MYYTLVQLLLKIVEHFGSNFTSTRERDIVIHILITILHTKVLIINITSLLLTTLIVHRINEWIITPDSNRLLDHKLSYHTHVLVDIPAVIVVSNYLFVLTN